MSLSNEFVCYWVCESCVLIFLFINDIWLKFFVGVVGRCNYYL